MTSCFFEVKEREEIREKRFVSTHREEEREREKRKKSALDTHSSNFPRSAFIQTSKNAKERPPNTSENTRKERCTEKEKRSSSLKKNPRERTNAPDRTPTRCTIDTRNNPSPRFPKGINRANRTLRLSPPGTRRDGTSCTLGIKNPLYLKSSSSR